MAAGSLATAFRRNNTTGEIVDLRGSGVWVLPNEVVQKVIVHAADDAATTQELSSFKPSRSIPHVADACSRSSAVGAIRLNQKR